MPPVDCPTIEELSAYLIGKLSDLRAEEVTIHVDACADCQAAVETLDQPEDKLVRSVRQSHAVPAFVAEDECRRAVARLQEMIPAPWSVKADNFSAPAAPSGTLTRLGGYELVTKLGEGGMGAVYKALQPRLDRWVAVKVLPANRLGDARAVARFEREIKAVGKLQHPNIVVAHHAGEEHGMHYLVMEYVDGCDLSSLVRQCGALTIADACEIVRQAAVALQHAHEHGLVHRDVKPSNLMLTTAGQVKLLDLGLALLGGPQTTPEELTGANQMMGTADYMAPEQAGDSHAVDIRADVYSLGCTLYKLLTGEAPFVGPQFSTSLQKMMAHVHNPIPPICERRNDVPAALVKVLAGMLAKKPAERYATPAAVAAAMVPFAADCDLPRLAARCVYESPEEPDASLSNSNTGHVTSNSLTSTQSTASAGNAIPVVLSASALESERQPPIESLLDRASSIGFAIYRRVSNWLRRRSLFLASAASVAAVTVLSIVASLFFGNGTNRIVAFTSVFRDAVELAPDEKLLKIHYHAVTRLVDWNGDTLLDLLVGDGEGYVWLFRNVGSKGDFRLAPGEHVKVGGDDLKAGAGFTTACFSDITGDGKRDLIVAHSDDRVRWYVNQGTISDPKLDGSMTLLGRDGAEFRLPLQCGARIDVGDWDEDGRPDILAGGYTGSIVFFKNTGTATSPRFEATGVPLTRQGNPWSEPYDVHPTIFDLNQDGRPDVAYGTNWGYVSFFISDPTPQGKSAFAFENHPVRLGNLDLRAIAGDDTTPTFGDVNGDGTLDMISGGSLGKLWLLLGVRPGAVGRNDPP